MTIDEIRRDVLLLPQNYKTKDIDALIQKYVKSKSDVSCLRSIVLSEQEFHRIYFHTMLKQMNDPQERMQFIDNNLLFSDWWHTDQLINLVSNIEPNIAFEYAERYITAEDPFIRRWGYVMFISKLCRNRCVMEKLLPMFKNDSEYYVQMAQAWLIAELCIFFPDDVFNYMENNDLLYSINGKAIQKICDSYRISQNNKERFKSLRPKLRHRMNN